MDRELFFSWIAVADHLARSRVKVRLPDLPVSSLTRAAFPVVYAQLLRSTGDEDFNVIPRLIMLPMSFFTDWDRAKPPSDLLLSAIDAGIDRKVIKRLSGTTRGHEYLSAIQRDANRQAAEDRARIQESFSRYWDEKR